MELNENIMQLIIRQLNGEASPEEREELSAWINESTSNKMEYDAYLKIWNDSSEVALVYNFDTANAWKKIEQKIQEPAVVIPMQKGHLFTIRRLAVAAAILIFVVAAAIYLFKANQETSWKTVAAIQSNQKISLPDGTVIMLRKGSTLRYPENYGNKERNTELKGEAYFQVLHDESRPFKVFTPGAVVEVLGTSFLVRNTDSLNQVVVNSGRVRFAKRNNTTQQVILTRGQEAELINNHFTRDTVLNTNYLSWENGKLVFHNTPLSQVAEDIGDLYNVTIVLSPELRSQADTITIKAEFQNETLEQVLDEIQLITGLSVSRENGTIIFRK